MFEAFLAFSDPQFQKLYQEFYSTLPNSYKAMSEYKKFVTLSKDSNNVNAHLNRLIKDYPSINSATQNKLLELFQAVGQANLYLNFTRKAYLKNTLEDIESEGGGKDWEFISDSSSVKNTIGYYGQVWINKNTKEIVIVSAGTKVDHLDFSGLSIFNNGSNGAFIKRLYNASKSAVKCVKDLFQTGKDIINDIQVISEQIPFQFTYGLKLFIDGTIEELLSDSSLDLKEYTLHFTGHSLGGVLSTLGTLHASKEYEESFQGIHALTFENPGANPAVKEYASQIGYSEENLFELAKKCINIQNNPNWINTINPQFGEVYQLPQHQVISIDYPTNELTYDLLSTMRVKISKLIGEANLHIESHDKGKFQSMCTLHSVTAEWPTGLAYDYFGIDKTKLQENIKLMQILYQASLKIFQQDYDQSIGRAIQKISQIGYDYISEVKEHLATMSNEYSLDIGRNIDLILQQVIYNWDEKTRTQVTYYVSKMWDTVADTCNNCTAGIIEYYMFENILVALGAVDDQVSCKHSN